MDEDEFDDRILKGMKYRDAEGLTEDKIVKFWLKKGDTE